MKKELFVWVLSTGLFVYAQDDAALTQKIQELESRIALMESVQEQQAFPELFGGALESKYGLGPGASKIYNVPAGVSLGGYGEALYTHDPDKTDVSDFLRAILYVGYKFNDQWVLNTEFEFEHASTSQSGSASVEFATLDYLHRPELNFRVGMVLVPSGLVNELHEPNLFLPVKRSETESRIIPSTWRENGIGLFGEVNQFRYKAYIVNGLKAEGFSDEGLRGGRQKGSKAESEDLAGILRVDWVPATNIMIGGSIYHGGSGQSLDEDVMTTIIEGHADLQLQALKLRALIASADLGDVASLNRSLATDENGVVPADSDIDSVGSSQLGWYVEAGYDLLHGRDAGEKALLPFIRYEQINTQEDVPEGFASSGANDRELITVGVHFRPLDEIVFKADYVTTNPAKGDASEQVNLSMGYVF